MTAEIGYIVNFPLFVPLTLELNDFFSGRLKLIVRRLEGLYLLKTMHKTSHLIILCLKAVVVFD